MDIMNINKIQYVRKEDYDAAIATISRLKNIISLSSPQYVVLDKLENKDLVFLGGVKIFVLPNAVVSENNFVRTDNNWSNVICENFGVTIQ